MDKEQFYDEIDKIVLDIVKKHPNFYFLMKKRNGIHPIDIKMSLGRLHKSKKISATIYRKVMKSAKDKGKVVLENDNLLPVPHLLDYDWRFDNQGIEKMFSIISKNCKRYNKVIAFVGTPSLFKMCYSKGDIKNEYILIDKNADKHIHYITRCSQYFSFFKCDIMNSQTIDIQADIVIMDPPWYLNYYKLFFQFANSLLKIGGKIICVMPPKYTRKNIGEELEDLKQFIGDLGITTEHYFRNAVSYSTPPFERNVLRENGIYCMPKGWRTGDILIAKKINDKKTNSEFIEIEENQWEEIDIGSVRYKLKTNQNLEVKSVDLVIEKIYTNDIYPSVKRSMSMNEKRINVWTSGNRVFYCSNIPLLYYILLEYSIRYRHYGLDINKKIESSFNIMLSEKQKENIMKCIKIIERVNKKEQQEYGRWRELL